ncbi:arsenate reductase (glutaredoxin) [Candidatus Vesicomyidisocius calyptogenae]|uniref:Arsenate reductase n=1 Tax=Vesicomyosocius okutanii subsp. Calyptogena okutanii (strain HA) TaxID=412965 RepID=A5CX83_VESOH|nr:arsenate reductase (glutaredoxin) [Candidatus Vesicomyosocius okutanii]BAF61432.1 arsenate reductase [Candidatus Vesicomyosocius okutanii]
MSIIIYHNPKCSKSRTTLAILEQKNVDFEIIKYLENPPTINELKQLLIDLKLEARLLIRKGELEYKEKGLDDKHLTEDQLISAMVKTPKLIERPIVRTSKGVVIGRPPENIFSIL